jgi:hypothetical protein
MIKLFRRWRLLHRAGKLYAKAKAAHAAGQVTDQMMAEVERLVLAAQALQPQGWSRLGVGPVGWRRVQFLAGVVNAYQAIDSLSRGQWLLAGFSSLVVLLVSRCNIPSKE